MSTGFWVRRFSTVFLGAFVVLTTAQWLLRGQRLENAALHGVIWAAVSATVFTAARIYHSRRGRHCAICNDTPEMRAPE